jgi:hypothetical protein
MTVWKSIGVLGAPLALAGAAWGQVEDPANHTTVFVGSGGAGAYKKVSGGVVIDTWARPATDGAFAVSGDIRSHGQNPGDVGLGYDLNGNANGSIYVNNSGLGTFFDGTTDGTFNYSIAADTGEVWRFDLGWQNGVPLFNTLANTSGITFDIGTGTIWVNHGIGPHQALQYDPLTGLLLASFAYNVGEDTAALAYDPLHGSFSICSSTGSSIYEFDSTGLLLGTMNPVGVQDVNAAEFAIPAPGGLALLVAGGLRAVRRRR